MALSTAKLVENSPLTTSKAMSTPFVGELFMLLVAIQVGVQPAVTRACVGKTVSGHSLVLAEMFVSMALAAAVMPANAFEHWSILESAMLVGPPAAVYAFRSLFKQAAYRRCDGVTFNVMNQTKVVFCALAAFFLMGEGQTLQQCMALLCAVAAGAMLVSPRGSDEATGAPNGHQGESTPGTSEEGGHSHSESPESGGTGTDSSPAEPIGSSPCCVHKDASLGVLPRAIASFAFVASGPALALATAACSGVAAALSQAAMRASARPSALFNLELVIWGLPLVVITSSDCKPQALLSGWQARTFAPVTLQAAGGLLVSAVVKQKGGVAMGLCTVAGIAVSAVVDAALMRRLPQRRQVLAACLCFASVVVHQHADLPSLLGLHGMKELFSG